MSLTTHINLIVGRSCKKHELTRLLYDNDDKFKKALDSYFKDFKVYDIALIFQDPDDRELPELKYVLPPYTIDDQIIEWENNIHNIKLSCKLQLHRFNHDNVFDITHMIIGKKVLQSPADEDKEHQIPDLIGISKSVEKKLKKIGIDKTPLLYTNPSDCSCCSF